MYSLGTNSWTDPHFGPVPEHQKIERIEVLAYLDAAEIQVPIDVLIRNDDLYDVDLKGWSVRDFNDLETDITEALRFLGYRTYVTERDRISMSFFERFNKK